MYLITGNKTECCGCAACMQACPKNCIEMKRDDEGFDYPHKFSDNCISCGLCEKVCPIDKESIKPNKKPLCYYGWHKDSKLRAESTSGAAFIGIAQVCSQNGVNFFSGAIYDEELHVKHICTDDKTIILKMRTSKYVQSSTEDVFAVIKSLLQKNEQVLFSGTPCQTEAIQRYVGTKLRDNLITVALVCHGVASPMIYEKYIEESETLHSSRIESIRFRDKRLLKDKLNHGFTTIHYKDGTIDSSVDNPYTMAYGLGYMHRPSCMECPFATPFRNADITIGDFWGIESLIPELSTEISKGISLILAHTQRGEKIVEQLASCMIIEHLSDYKTCINKQQPQLSKPYAGNPKRKQFITRVMKSAKGFTRETKKILLLRRCMGYKNYIIQNIKKIFK